MNSVHSCDESTMNCMTLIAGRDVSFNQRVLVGHNEDDPGHLAVRHAYVPAQDWDAGSVLPAEEGCAQIPQVPHTFGYYWIEFKADNGGITNADAFANENGVVITTNSMGRSREDMEDASVVRDGGIGYNLRRVLAERARSARDGARVLIDMMETWGYAMSGRAYTIADTLMSKTLTVVVNDLQVVCDTVSSHLFAISPYSNNLQRVVASLQTYNVYTTIRTIVANQLLVDLSIISILTTLHIYIICLCRRKK